MTKSHAAWIGASGLVMVGAMAAFFLTRSATVTVTARDWRREIQVQDYQPRPYAGWDETVPTDAYDITCRTRQRSSHRVSMGETCTGTGSRRTCTTDYVTIPDYDQWCEYTADRWGYKRSLISEGQAEIPAWAAVDVTPCEGYGCEREADHLERYNTYLADQSTGDVYTCAYEQDYWSGLRVGTVYGMDVGQVIHIPRCETLRSLP
jgi:hypothetical protein